RLITVGTAIGLLLSYASSRLLTSEISGISVTDPWTFAAVAVAVIIVGLFASYLPARRAARVDPIIALRRE
ncbi:MAG: FtsX-like permease family protein, partial [Candidatus Acidiferrales bacterium]